MPSEARPMLRRVKCSFFQGNEGVDYSPKLGKENALGIQTKTVVKSQGWRHRGFSPPPAFFYK